MTARLFTHRYTALIPALLLTVALGTPSAQTVITPDKNKYTPAEDVQIGLEAAAEVRKQLPLLDDSTVEDYVEDIGRRLVDAVPPQFEHPEFRYSFDVVNQREINAFALPGGPMFVHRGMMEAANSEGEVAGVMAHELAHVVLRHGTAQATKAQKFQIGAIAGQILGAIVGGTAGNVISAGSQFGLGTYFLKYGREYERQADLLGAQIMARAGYDPRNMAEMFRTIERQGSRGGPEWMSSHPNPGNRYDAIIREAQVLEVRGRAPSQTAFNRIKSQLGSMPPAYTAEQVARGQVRRGGGGRDPDDVRRTTRTAPIEPPSARYRTYPVGNFLRLSVPDNWQQIQGNNTVIFAPDGGYSQSRSGGTTFTHGVEIGTIRNESHDLEEGTDELIDSFSRANPALRPQGGYRRDTIGGRSGLTAILTNVSEDTGAPELVTISTVQLRDGSLLYLVGVSPEEEAASYDRALRRVRQTMRITERTTTLRR